MMALDGKAIIKEEITDKDAYDAATAAAAAAAVAVATSTAASSASSSTASSAAAVAAAAAAAAAAVNTAANAAAISRRLKANSSSSSSSNSSNGDKNSSTSSSIGSNSSNSKDMPTSASNNTSNSQHTPNGSRDRERERERERDRERERERDRLCRTPPDSPPDEGRSMAPHSPHSPPQQLHVHQRPQRNASASPIVNGGASSATSPTPGSQHAASLAAAAAAAAAAHVEQGRLLSKLRKFLGALIHFSQELGQPDVSERVRALVLSLCSGTISVEEFRLALQEAINLPLRPYVMPLLKNSMVLMQREIMALARATNQSPLQYVTSNEQSIMELTAHGVASGEFADIFVQLEAPQATSGNVNGGLLFKRRSSDSMMEHAPHGLQEWSDYMASGAANTANVGAAAAVTAYAPPSKRLAIHPAGSHSVLAFDYSAAAAAAAAAGDVTVAAGFMQRDERDLRLGNESQSVSRHAAPKVARGNNAAAISALPGNGVAVASVVAGASGVGGAGGEEEWKNIHTMLNCISAMVDKTKRAITILQQRGIEPQHGSGNSQELTPAALAELRRQTEEKVAEFKRNAEDAVTQVKRQAVIEIQRAVVAAETRAAEIMTQERLRMEKFFMEMSRHSSGERDLDNKSPSITSAQNGSNLQQQCWNCGRKATETCSGCNMARYCSASCQYRDWDSHHQVCANSRASELSAKHLHSTSSSGLRSAMASRSPPTPTAAAAAAAASAHLQAAAVGAREAAAAAAAAAAATVSGTAVAGGGVGGGGVATVGSGTPGALVPNGLGSK